MSDETEARGDETTELDAAPLRPEVPEAPVVETAPDIYLMVLCAFAGAILALIGTIFAMDEDEDAEGSPRATVASPASPPPAPEPSAPPPPRVRPLEAELGDDVSLPTPEDDMPYSVPVAAKCAWTRVRSVGSRFAPSPDDPPGADTDFSNGISVVFSNGLDLISYTSNPAIERTKVGSRVQACLVQEMRGCPPGDDRGKTYRVYDPIQGIAWTMGDSLHICGGA